MPLSSLLTSALSSLTSLHRRPSLSDSIHSFMSNTANFSKNRSRKGRKDNASYRSSKSSFQRKNEPSFLRDPVATTKLLDCILESPNGKRTLSRVARTCQAMREPTLNTLWRELDSIVPLVWQFPGHLFKKARRPGMGFVKTPTQEDWENALKYADRVRQITYNENASNVAASIFSILEETCPRTYIFPRLLELNWKVETPANFGHCTMFLNPELRVVNLEVAGRVPNLNSFLSDLSSHTRLTSFSFISPTNLPDAFTRLLKRQDALEQVVLVAPGALAPGVGRWVASLPQLRALRLDLTGRSPIAVEGFFDDLHTHSGASTPHSIGSTDSGVFSEEDTDFSVIRSKSKESFAEMRKLFLTGEVSNISVFITHLQCPLTHLELVIEDPPDRADWHDLSSLICEKFGNSLQSLKISATASPRFVDLARSTPRAGQLSLERLTCLPYLSRLEIDLPESIIFTDSGVESIANACPNLEILKLCPVARVSSAPKITLDSLAILLVSCRRLHTIAAVVDAKKGSPDILRSRQTSSTSLLRLHFGHSWIGDPLQVAILLSHLAPRLETLKFFQDKNRPGFIEANARNWQKVTELLPHLQGVRLLEKQLSPPVVHIQPTRPETLEKGVDALVRTVEQEVQVAPELSHVFVQCSPILLDQAVQAEPAYHSISIDATPTTVDSGVEAITVAVDREIDVTPPSSHETTDTEPPNITKSVEGMITPYTFRKPVARRRLPSFLIFPSLLGLLSCAYRLLILYPMSLPSRIIRTASAQIPWRLPGPIQPQNPLPSYGPSSGPEIMDIHMDTLGSEVGL